MCSCVCVHAFDSHLALRATQLYIGSDPWSRRGTAGFFSAFFAFSFALDSVTIADLAADVCFFFLYFVGLVLRDLRLVGVVWSTGPHDIVSPPLFGFGGLFVRLGPTGTGWSRSQRSCVTRAATTAKGTF